ncbi:pantoate-beta-alanine ligase [Cardiosporidium cionae]|uniref:3-methyl-2-oxobutanoate hydroxymethyltransferase n=1 Tax=Cardiosporidium cionae TaxID=476202 RepID=A0ABQ7JGK0_9APIC|nr:pantoate-beta-alanine ligase [Cardiosporidium cionae]|eukprot:KAF8823069.1 pantoate-beta-alanine ligase [Cardiosporidium cionae]
MGQDAIRPSISWFCSRLNRSFTNGTARNCWAKKQFRFVSSFTPIGTPPVKFSFDGFHPNQLRTFYTGSPIGLRIPHLQSKKGTELKISMITAYDHISATIADECLVDSILVGDSLGNVVWGSANTNKVDMDSMVYHSRIVSSAVKRAFLITDLPFASYSTLESALRNSERLVREGGAHCVKLEGFCPEIVKEVSKLVPVCSHLGLLPQTAISMQSRGKTAIEGAALLEEALELEKAGCSLLVLEKMCAEVAKEISQRLTIPTIGIGSGYDCDGQVLVWHDVIGLHRPDFQLKFAKKYADSYSYMKKAVDLYIREVERGEFPERKHSFYMNQKEKSSFLGNLSKTVGTLEIPCDATSTLIKENKEQDLTRTELIKKQANATLHGSVSPTPAIRRVLIRGSGGVGSLLATHLSKVNGIDVTMYTHWKEHAEVIQNMNGNRLRVNVSGMPLSSWPEASQKYSGHVNVVCEEEEIEDHAFDVGFICVKSYDTENAVKFLDRKVRKDGAGAIVSFQNGFEAFAIIRKNLAGTSPRAILFGALTGGAAILVWTLRVLACSIYKAHRVHPLENGILTLSGKPLLKLAPLCQDTVEIANNVSALLCSGGLYAESCRVYELSILQWQKVAINCAINGLTSLFGCSNGTLADPHFDALAVVIVTEVCFIARKHGIPLEKESILVAVRHTIENTANNISSTLQDLRKGRKTEIGAICGAVSKMAKAVHETAPLNDFLNKSISLLEVHKNASWKQDSVRLPSISQVFDSNMANYSDACPIYVETKLSMLVANRKCMLAQASKNHLNAAVSVLILPLQVEPSHFDLLRFLNRTETAQMWCLSIDTNMHKGHSHEGNSPYNEEILQRLAELNIKLIFNPFNEMVESQCQASLLDTGVAQPAQHSSEFTHSLLKSIAAIQPTTIHLIRHEALLLHTILPSIDRFHPLIDVHIYNFDS